MNKAVKTVGFIAAATMMAKLMGVFRDIILAQSFGTGYQLDAFMAASKIPLLFFDFTLGAAITSTFIPVFNRYLQRGEERQAKDFSNSFINIVVLISAIFCVVGMLFPAQLTNLIAGGFEPEQKELTEKLLVTLLPTVIFTTLAYSFVGLLQSHGEFNIPAIISLVSNAAVIVYMLFFSKRFGIYGLAVAMLIGWSLQAIVQIPSLVRLKFRYRFKINLRDQGIKDAFVLALPILVSSWHQPICVLVNTRFASFFQTGSVSALEYANRLYIIVVGVFVYAITNYVFPDLSKKSGGGDIAGFKHIMTKSIVAMFVIILPIMAGMMIISREIIMVVYARGAFDETSVALTGAALLFYSIGMLAYGANEILNKCFYAMTDGKTPMIATFFGIIGVVVFSFISAEVVQAGVGGLALSASLSTVIVSVVLIYKMQRKVPFIDKKLIVLLLKAVFCVGVMLAAAYIAKQLSADMGKWLGALIPVAAGGAVYLPLLWLLGMHRVLKEEMR